MARPMAANVARAGYGIETAGFALEHGLKDVRYALAAGIDVEARR